MKPLHLERQLSNGWIVHKVAFSNFIRSFRKPPGDVPPNLLNYQNFLVLVHLDVLEAKY